MSRVSKASVNAVFDRAISKLTVGAGADKRISRADAAKVVASIKDQTEAKFTDMLFKFIDHRDAAAGNTVGVGDLAKGAAYSKKELIGDYDLNNNGLSDAETAKMSTTGKLAVSLAKALKLSPPPAAE